MKSDSNLNNNRADFSCTQIWRNAQYIVKMQYDANFSLITFRSSLSEKESAYIYTIEYVNRALFSCNTYITMRFVIIRIFVSKYPQESVGNVSINESNLLDDTLRHFVPTREGNGEVAFYVKLVFKFASRKLFATDRG